MTDRYLAIEYIEINKTAFARLLVRTPWREELNRFSGRPAGASCATLERTTLVLAHAAPDSGILTVLQSPLQAGVHYLAAAAHLFGLGDLGDSGTGVSYGEEELRVDGETCGLAAPVHKGPQLSLARLVRARRPRPRTTFTRRGAVGKTSIVRPVPMPCRDPHKGLAC